MKQWIAFLILGLAWGANFMWIKVAVQEIGPLMLVALRLGFGFLGMLVVMRVSQTRFPSDRKVWLKLGILGAINPALPFVLISWGEQEIASGLAAVLNSTMPLFVLVLAHFWLHDERITIRKSIGLGVGFAGVLVIVTRDIGPQGLTGSLIGQLAVILASCSYATGATFTRRYLRGVSPIVQTAGVLLTADVLLWIVTPVFEQPLVWPAQPLTWLAIGWLGLLGTTVGYLMLFYLINEWGPTRSSLVTYVLPVIGLILGIVFLDEVVGWRLWLGAALIVGGILTVNLQALRESVLNRRKVAETAAAD